MNTYNYQLEATRDKTIRWLEDIDNGTRKAMVKMLEDGEVTRKEYWNFEENFDSVMNGYYSRAQNAADETTLILLITEVQADIAAANG